MQTENARQHFKPALALPLIKPLPKEVDMANGQVVLVTTEGLSGGLPMRTVYYVAEEDPIKAQAIIGKIMAPNEKVEA
jgi:hypothetical protein